MDFRNALLNLKNVIRERCTIADGSEALAAIDILLADDSFADEDVISLFEICAPLRNTPMLNKALGKIDDLRFPTDVKSVKTQVQDVSAEISARLRAVIAAEAKK